MLLFDAPTDLDGAYSQWEISVPPRAGSRSGITGGGDERLHRPLGGGGAAQRSTQSPLTSSIRPCTPPPRGPSSARCSPSSGWRTSPTRPTPMGPASHSCQPSGDRDRSRLDLPSRHPVLRAGRRRGGGAPRMGHPRGGGAGRHCRASRRRRPALGAECRRVGRDDRLVAGAAPGAALEHRPGVGTGGGRGPAGAAALAGAGAGAAGARRCGSRRTGVGTGGVAPRRCDPRASGRPPLRQH